MGYLPNSLINISSVSFVAFSGLCIVLFNLLEHAWWRRTVLLVFSLVFICSQVSSVSALAPLTGFLILSVGLIFLVATTKRQWLLYLSVATLIAAFATLKPYGLLDGSSPAEHGYTLVGLSYILFRALHVLVDTYEGSLQVTGRHLVSLLTYLLSFLTFVAGPIQRFEVYRRQEQGLATYILDQDAVYVCLLRIAVGYIKLLFVAEFFRSLHLHSSEVLAESGFPFMVSAFAYVLFVYSNFSGYMDVIIGIGRLIGFELPENFNYPLSSSNFIDLWNRWHITVSNTFKVYLFNPVLKGLASWVRDPNLIPYCGVATYFLVFFVLGLWHGSGWMFAILGILLAFGVSMNKLYEIEMKRSIGPEGLGRLRTNRVYAATARSITLTYFALALTPAWPTLSHPVDLLDLLQIVGLSALIGQAVGAVLFLSAGQLLYSWILNSSTRIIGTGQALMRNAVVKQAWLALLVLMVGLGLIHLSTSEAPEVVYKGF